MKTILLSLMTIVFCRASVAGETWFVTSLNWQPYSGAEMINEGNAVQKLKSVLRQHDIETLFEFYPWSRAQVQAKEKGYLGYFPAWPEEVQEGFMASVPIAWSEIAVLAMTDKKIVFSSIEDLFRDHTVGLVRTYVYPENITKAAQAFPDNVLYADNEQLLAKKLHAGRHDTAITDPLVMGYIAERHSLEGISMIKMLSKKPLVIAMTDSEENRTRIAKINQIFGKPDKTQSKSDSK